MLERRIRDLGRLGSSPFIPIPGNGVKLLTNFPLALCSSKNVLSATRLGLLRHTSAVCLCGILYVRHTSAVYYTRGTLVRCIIHVAYLCGKSMRYNRTVSFTCYDHAVFLCSSLEYTSNVYLTSALCFLCIIVVSRVCIF